LRDKKAIEGWWKADRWNSLPHPFWWLSYWEGWEGVFIDIFDFDNWGEVGNEKRGTSDSSDDLNQ
jgi:hypothetical protein